MEVRGYLDKFLEWRKSCTREELKLLEKAIDMEEKYFSDMTLKDYCEKLGRYQVKHEGEWIDITDSEYLNGVDISDGWRFKIARDLDCLGRCNSKERLIEINESNKDDETTLLHELIHAYESMLSEGFKQYLLIDLYERLLPQVPRLKELLTSEMHCFSYRRIGHTPLFILKSLDLDLRLNRPLGTIYGYGKTNELAAFLQVKQAL